MPKTDLRKKIGRLGEDIAERWLLRNGYKLIKNDYLIRGGQIDLIMEDSNGDIVFIEVKTRITTGAEPIISKMQILRLQRAARKFLAENDLQNRIWRVDLIWIDIKQPHKDQKEATVRHHQNILGR